jgi:xylan 1,4-beta-xylosidase
MTLSRRDLIAAGAAAAALPVGGEAAAKAAIPQSQPRFADNWRRGFDNQRIADLGDGHFLNPIMAGDHPDPTILKDGADYYMTFSTFDAYPGLLIWHSRDLVNWRPIGPALTRNIGAVWAPDLCKHGGRYYIYIPTKGSPDGAAPGAKRANTSWVIWADRIEGPWSDPVDLHLPDHIDPGHAVGEDGSRWLFLSGGDRVRLTDDGLATVGKPEHVYDPWHYPDDWSVEGFSPEGPKITRHGGWFYLITAVGGTAGPPTGHMVIAARSRSIHGPWEHHPGNPLVRSESSAEKWWSRGHATLVEARDGGWWSVYHGYENGYWTLGRQTLLDPVEWTADGWFHMRGGDLSQPIAAPKGGKAGPHGQKLSDDFMAPALGSRWNFFRPGPDEARRLTVAGGTLSLEGAGSGPIDGAPLLLIAGDQAYRFECRIEVPEEGHAGLLLFYDDKLHCGLGFDAAKFRTHQYGIERGKPAHGYGRQMWMRLTNDRHIVTFHVSADGKTWKRFDRGMEVSGYHHNVRGGFLMLRPGLYAASKGTARFSGFRFTALG